MIELTRGGASLFVEDEDQAKTWESYGYKRVTKAADKSAKSSKPKK